MMSAKFGYWINVKSSVYFKKITKKYDRNIFEGKIK